MQDQIASLFQATLQPNMSVRQEAEKNLKAFEQNAGFIQIVLQIATSNTANEVKMAAALYFKNFVRQQWNPEGTLAETDKEAVKSNIVQALVQSPHAIQIVLCSAISTIISQDYPEKWQSINQITNQLLSSQELHLYHSGLLILKEMVNCYRWKSIEKRAPLNWIINNFFPLILSRSSSLISDDVNVAQTLHLTLKIYFYSIQLEMASTLKETSCISQWGNLFIQVVQKTIKFPDNVSSEEVDLHPWSKAKKWAFHCIYHIFSKHADPSYIKKDNESQAFSKLFLDSFAPQILQVYLNVVEQIVNGTPVSSRIKQQLALFFADCIKYKNTWKIIKPFLEPLISAFVFPQMSYNTEDLEMLSDDPVEFVSSKLDFIQDFRSVGSAAKELLVALVKNRFKMTFVPILNFINQMLATSDLKNIDGALGMLAAIADYTLAPKSPVKSQMQSVVMSHIVPHISSNVDFMKIKACDTLIAYSEIEFDPESISVIFTSIAECLKSSNVAVKTYGILAMGPLLSNEHFQKMLKPHAADIMQVLLGLTSEIETDAVTEVMNSFVEYFSDDLVPCAVQLGQQMSNTFMRIFKEIDMNEMAESTEKTMAAVGVLKTISSLVLAVENSPTVLVQLQQVILPVCRFGLENFIFDIYDEIFDIIDSCSYCAKSISPDLWNLFPLIHKCYLNDGFDYLEDMMPALDNYLTFGKEQVTGNQQLQEMFFQFARVAIESGEDSDVVRGCQILESMMLNVRGIERYLTKILEYSVQSVDLTEKHPSFQVHTINLAVNALYYDPILSVKLLQESGSLEKVMQKWIASGNNLVRVHDKRLSILAICKLFAFSSDPLLHQLVTSAFPHLIQFLVQLLTKYPEAVQERKRVKEMMESQDDYSDDGLEDSFNELDNDEDVFEQEIYRQATATGNIDESAFDEDDDYDYDIYGLEEDPFFITCLDDIDPYVAVKQTLNSLPVPLSNEQIQAFATLLK